MTNRLVAALFMVLLLAAGCSSSSGDTAVASGSEEDVAESEAAAAPESTDDNDNDDNDASSSDDSASDSDSGDSAASGDDTPMAESSPIGAFFSDGGLEESIAEYTIKVEEEIVVCMAEQGFEFRQSGRRNNEIQERQNELTEREWTETYGYGISTSFESFMTQQGTDPNAELFFTMQPGERDAWVAALFGEEGGIGGGPVDSDTPLEEQGCIGQGIINTGGQEVIESLDDVGASYDEGLEGINDDPSMIDAISAWTRCMSETGFPDYSELDAPEDDIGDRLSALTAGLGDAIGELSPEEGQSLMESDSLDAVPGLDVDALRKLQDEELKVAVADLDCFETHVAETFLPLRDAFERGLLDEYQSEFNALKNIGG